MRNGVPLNFTAIKYILHFITQLFLKCQLIERILEAWEMNEKKQWVTSFLISFNCLYTTLIVKCMYDQFRLSWQQIRLLKMF